MSDDLSAASIPLAVPARPRTSRRRRLVSVCGIAACVMFAVHVYRSPRINPAFTLEALQGLTPDEVTARLGPAVIDPRLPRWGGWTPADETAHGDRLVLMYYDHRFLGRLAGRSYGIMFAGGRVQSVSVGEK